MSDGSPLQEAPFGGDDDSNTGLLDSSGVEPTGQEGACHACQGCLRGKKCEKRKRRLDPCLEGGGQGESCLPLARMIGMTFP